MSLDMHVVMVDHEIGKATFVFPAIADLAAQVGAVGLYLDEEHDMFLLCKHPITGIADYHSVTELLNPTAVPPDKPKLSTI